jgi:signal transduction histidine kinase
LADLAAEALDLVAAEAAHGGLRTRTDLRPARVAGDLALLSRAVANLVENAVRHNRLGGELTVTTGTDDGHAWITVTNTGADLSATPLEPLFEPFHRGERSRLDGGGAGLGLSIVAAVARAHGGSVTAAARPLAAGGGLTLDLRLPTAL